MCWEDYIYISNPWSAYVKKAETQKKVKNRDRLLRLLMLSSFRVLFWAMMDGYLRSTVVQVVLIHPFQLLEYEMVWREGQI